jgi:hypothetical protein
MVKNNFIPAIHSREGSGVPYANIFHDDVISTIKEDEPIIVTKEQAGLIRKLPKNTSEWESIWRRCLLKQNIDPVTVERIIKKEREI